MGNSQAEESDTSSDTSEATIGAEHKELMQITASGEPDASEKMLNDDHFEIHQRGKYGRIIGGPMGLKNSSSYVAVGR